MLPKAQSQEPPSPSTEWNTKMGNPYPFTLPTPWTPEGWNRLQTTAPTTNDNGVDQEAADIPLHQVVTQSFPVDSSLWRYTERHLRLALTDYSRSSGGTSLLGLAWFAGAASTTTRGLQSEPCQQVPGDSL